VSDRRRFDPEGRPREEAASSGAAPESSAEPGGTEQESPGAGETEAAAGSAGEQAGASGRTQQDASQAQGARPQPPPASFELLVLSLAMQAQIELGFGGQQQDQTPNLDLARHTIDLLGVLQEKTKGNLSLEEKRLLENTLTELRFRYIQAVEEINKKSKG